MYLPAKIMLPLVIFILFIKPVTAEEPEESVSAPQPVPVPQQSQTAVPNKKPYFLGAALGYTFSGYREETDAPLNRSLNTLSFAVNGNVEKDKFFHLFNFGLSKAKIYLEYVLIQPMGK